MDQQAQDKYVVLVVGPVTYYYLKDFKAKDFEVCEVGSQLQCNADRPVLFLIEREAHRLIYETRLGLEWFREVSEPFLIKQIVWL